MATAEVGYQTHDLGKHITQTHDLGKKQTHLHGNGHNDEHHHTRAISQSTDSSKNGNHKVTYEDPNADVALRSSDGRIFKVESYVLKAHS